MSSPPPARQRGAEQKNFLFLFRRKNWSRAKQKSGEHFFAGHASGASGGGADSFVSDFENRCELGTIKTPRQNSTAFSKLEGGTREARPNDFPPFFQTNSEILARLRALIFRQEAGSKSRAIQIYLLDKKNFCYNTFMEQKFFLYARKSTDVEDKQVLSIEAQVTELRTFAREQG